MSSLWGSLLGLLERLEDYEVILMGPKGEVLLRGILVDAELNATGGVTLYIGEGEYHLLGAADVTNYRMSDQRITFFQGEVLRRQMPEVEEEADAPSSTGALVVPGAPLPSGTPTPHFPS